MACSRSRSTCGLQLLAGRGGRSDGGRAGRRARPSRLGVAYGDASDHRQLHAQHGVSVRAPDRDQAGERRLARHAAGRGRADAAGWKPAIWTRTCASTRTATCTARSRSAVALERKVKDKDQRVVVVGSSRFLSNAVRRHCVGNLDLGVNMFNWLSAGREPDHDPAARHASTASSSSDAAGAQSASASASCSCCRRRSCSPGA